MFYNGNFGICRLLYCQNRPSSSFFFKEFFCREFFNLETIHEKNTVSAEDKMRGIITQNTREEAITIVQMREKGQNMGRSTQ